jgi:DNA polymerase-3 subunit alpha
MCNFTHLHVHTEYSALDGAARAEELAQTASEMGMTALACTDHGTASGLWQFQKACDKHNIKPILGLEFYYAYEEEFAHHEFRGNGHLVVLAKNSEGLRNIFKLQEYSYVHGFHRKPRIDFETLCAHREGLIVTSSCLGSTFNQLIMKGDVRHALEWARKFRDVFQDDFYIELQPNQIPEQHICNLEGIRIARELGIRLVATNDVHYTFETDCFPHEVLLALQTNKKMDDPKRFKFDTNDFWLKSEEEMRSTFEQLEDSVVEEAFRGTKEIESKCNARIEPGHYFAEFHDLNGVTPRKALVEKVMEGAREKGHVHDEPYMREVQEEIDVIDRNGYANYFLIVQDYIESAKRNSVIVGDRGSVGGSKVAYLSGISTVEPKEYDLLFERFLSDGRIPDIDADFSDQDAVFEDLVRKHGEESVARVIAFGTLAPKAVTRKVFNAFGHDMSYQKKVTSLIPEDAKSVAHALTMSVELFELSRKHSVEFNVITRLEGIVSHESVHAGGVIIYPDLSNYLPLKTNRDNPTKRIAAWDKDMLEEVGFHKYDILGLKTLPVIRKALDFIRDVTGEEIDLDSIDFDDQAVYDMLCKGDVSGVFQLAAQSGKVVEQQPRNFRDIIAINALIRPGTGDWDAYIARRRGADWFIDPNRPWMHETFGTITYQEQFLWDCHVLAGWSVAYADRHVRKGKNLRENHELREKFLSDGEANGHAREYLASIWEEILASTGDYSFNKSHAATYGRLSFKTAWLKCHYPQFFYAALMSIEGDDQDAISAYIAECKTRGIAILPPDINHSSDDFVPTLDGIRFRINTIRHVGESALKGIYELRPVASFDDFMARRKKSEVKANTLDSLIKAGCFDFDEPNRALLLWKVDMMNRTITQVKNDVICPRYDWNDTIKAALEFSVLGMYLSLHPLSRFRLPSIHSFAENEEARIGGRVTNVEVRPDKKGNNMGFVTLDTEHGSVRVLIFSFHWARKDTQALFVEDSLIEVKGKKSGDSLLYSWGSVLA